MLALAKGFNNRRYILLYLNKHLNRVLNIVKNTSKSSSSAGSGGGAEDLRQEIHNIFVHCNLDTGDIDNIVFEMNCNDTTRIKVKEWYDDDDDDDVYEYKLITSLLCGYQLVFIKGTNKLYNAYGVIVPLCEAGSECSV